MNIPYIFYFYYTNTNTNTNTDTNTSQFEKGLSFLWHAIMPITDQPICMGTIACSLLVLHNAPTAHFQHSALGNGHVICNMSCLLTMPVCTMQYFLFQYRTLHIFAYTPFASVCSLLHSHYSLLAHIYDQQAHDCLFVLHLYQCMQCVAIKPVFMHASITL